MNTKVASVAFAALVAAFAALTVSAADAEGYESLFDGKTLKGWKVLGGDAKFYVKDGVIVGEGMPSTLGINTFLTTEKLYGDFDFKVEFLSESGNSGVQFRGETREKYDPAWDWNPFKEGLHKVFGYQAEITPYGGCTGRIYDEERRGYRYGIIWLDKNTPGERSRAAEATFKKNGWNEMRVRCEGPHIQTWLNGKPVADILDDMSKKGFIGLQVHQQGPAKEGQKFNPMFVRFRNPRVKELASPKAVSEIYAIDATTASNVVKGLKGPLEVQTIKFGDRTVIRLGGAEVYDSGK